MQTVPSLPGLPGRAGVCENLAVPRVLERAVGLVLEVAGTRVGETPWWLQRPGRAECGHRWPLVSEVDADLTKGGELPVVAPMRERRTVDAVLVDEEGGRRILEVDEVQHFNAFRAATLHRYQHEVTVAFDVEAWLQRCRDKTRLERGGFAQPRPPLFPGQNGRHRQRAFRDALADILPGEHGWLPTLRIADCEVEGWLHDRDAPTRMERLLRPRLAG